MSPRLLRRLYLSAFCCPALWALPWLISAGVTLTERVRPERLEPGNVWVGYGGIYLRQVPADRLSGSLDTYEKVLSDAKGNEQAQREADVRWDGDLRSVEIWIVTGLGPLVALVLLRRWARWLRAT